MNPGSGLSQFLFLFFNPKFGKEKDCKLRGRKSTFYWKLLCNTPFSRRSGKCCTVCSPQQLQKAGAILVSFCKRKLTLGRVV